MNERTCKKCGSIDYDIWGTIGLIGYSLIVGALGYAISVSGFFSPRMIIIAVVFGVIFWLPMWFISIHERKEISNNEKEL